MSHLYLKAESDTRINEITSCGQNYINSKILYNFDRSSVEEGVAVELKANVKHKLGCVEVKVSIFGREFRGKKYENGDIFFADIGLKEAGK